MSDFLMVWVVVTVPEVGSVVAWPVYSSAPVLVYVIPLLVTVRVQVHVEAAEAAEERAKTRENFMLGETRKESEKFLGGTGIGPVEWEFAPIYIDKGRERLKTAIRRWWSTNVLFLEIRCRLGAESALLVLDFLRRSFACLTLTHILALLLWCNAARVESPVRITMTLA